ncbi:hypothetical protein L484_018577 [Morus notabilis]|uniref:Transmembrane protein n=1 Tax=Morus notabilis TaxID=981085 RepID=W9R745_9ROSA|nr:hypothetical protein L484_018577 [Morus notabilis]
MEEGVTNFFTVLLSVLSFVALLLLGFISLVETELGKDGVCWWMLNVDGGFTSMRCAGALEELHLGGFLIPMVLCLFQPSACQGYN